MYTESVCELLVSFVRYGSHHFDARNFRTAAPDGINRANEDSFRNWIADIRWPVWALRAGSSSFGTTEPDAETSEVKISGTSETSGVSPAGTSAPVRVAGALGAQLSRLRGRNTKLKTELKAGRVSLGGKGRSGCIPFLVKVMKGMPNVQFTEVSSSPAECPPAVFAVICRPVLSDR